MTDQEGTELDWISEQVIGAGIEVHRELGPGLLERTYRRCLRWELEQRDLQVQEETVIPIQYKGTGIEDTYRLDLCVEQAIVVEIKAVENVLPVHKAQLLTYLRLADKPLGLLLNFHEPRLVDGVTRVMH